MDNRELYIQFGLRCLNFRSRQDLYENLYLKALVDSYQRIDKSLAIENTIRDRFILDLINCNSFTLELVKKDILQIDFERQHFVSEKEKRRTDIVLFISGFGNFTIECKRLYHEESRNAEYIENGLSRFINLKYSKDNGWACMMGFIITGDIVSIKNTLKRKCEDVCYIQNEFVEIPFGIWNNSFKTTHKRKDYSTINMYHLFFEFN